ncbi:MAG: hypothetical protein FWF84_01065 [Kiritimatiellaeota bacterium]|nr:hypothetical protein [Kiritimatiellota bacterium]
MEDTPQNNVTPQEGAPESPTVRVKPLVIPGAPTPTVRLKPVIPGVTPIKPPSAEPAAPAAAPTDPAVQAAKGKTSRISLDAAILNPTETSGPKTIRLKRPMDAPVGKLTSHLPAPDADAPTLASPDDGGTPTQRKTIRVKKPGVAIKTGSDDEGATLDGEGADATSITLDSAPETEKVNAIFPILAVASIAALLALIGLLVTSPGMDLVGF